MDFLNEWMNKSVMNYWLHYDTCSSIETSFLGVQVANLILACTYAYSIYFSIYIYENKTFTNN